MKKFIQIVAIILVVVFLIGTTTTYAISLFQKNLAGSGQMNFTNEVTITDVKVKSLSKVDVTVESNAQTLALRNYSIYLYLDDVKWETPMTVSWTAGEIPGTQKKVSFSGLSLGPTGLVEVEVVY